MGEREKVSAAEERTRKRARQSRGRMAKGTIASLNLAAFTGFYLPQSVKRQLHAVFCAAHTTARIADTTATIPATSVDGVELRPHRLPQTHLIRKTSLMNPSEHCRFSCCFSDACVARTAGMKNLDGDGRTRNGRSKRSGLLMRKS